MLNKTFDTNLDDLSVDISFLKSIMSIFKNACILWFDNLRFCIFSITKYNLGTGIKLAKLHFISKLQYQLKFNKIFQYLHLKRLGVCSFSWLYFFKIWLYTAATPILLNIDVVKLVLKTSKVYFISILSHSIWFTVVYSRTFFWNDLSAFF